MKTVGAIYAKTHLNKLLERAFKGEVIRITRRGIPMAKLVPLHCGDQQDPEQVVEDIRRLRRGVRLGNISVRELIEEGRRY